MERLSLTRLRFVNPNVRALIGPGALSLILVSLFMFLFKNGYSQISRQVTQLRAEMKNEVTLEEKVTILVEVKSALGSANEVVIALPYKNPGLWALSQLKGAAAANAVAISEIGLVDEREFGESLTKMQIELEAEAAEPGSITAFLKAVEGLAPVTSLDSAAIQEKSGSVTSEIKLSVYWSELPSTLPPIASPVKELSESERELLDKLSTLTAPEFIDIGPSAPSIRENPFN